jgi:hypothetical protein
VHQVGACIRRNPGARSRARVLQMPRSVLASRHLKAVPFDYSVTMFAAGWVVLDKTLALNHPLRLRPRCVRHSVAVAPASSCSLHSKLVYRLQGIKKRWVARVGGIRSSLVPCSRSVRHSTAQFTTLPRFKSIPWAYSVHQVRACIRRNPGARSRARVLQMLRSVLASRHLNALPCAYPVLPGRAHEAFDTPLLSSCSSPA